MGKFIVNILSFSLVLLCITVSFNFTFEKFYYKGYSDVELNFNTYLLADSRGKYLGQFNKESGIYNFSANGHSYLDMLRKVRFLIRKSDIKRIILAVDDHLLAKYRETSGNLDKSVVFAEPKDFNNYIDFLKNRVIKRYIPLLNPKSRDIIKLRFLKVFKSIFNIEDKKRESWDKLSEEERLIWTELWMNSYFAVHNQSEALTDALEEIIMQCQLNKIELIGIKFPIPNTTYNLTIKKGYHADSMFINRALQVLDFTSIYLDNNTYFLDPGHLSEIGSEKFTDTLLYSFSRIHKGNI